MLRRFTGLSNRCKTLFFLLFAIAFISLVSAGSLLGQKKLKERLEELHGKFEEHQQELEQTDKEFRETQKKLQQAREQENSILSLLEKYDRQINSTRRRMQNLRRQEKEARTRLEEVEEEMEELEELLNKREKLLRKRLREIYKHGEMSQLELVFKAKSLDNLVLRSRYFREIINHDREIIKAYRESKEKQRELRKERSAILRERQQLRRNVKETLSELKATKERRKEALNDLRQRKTFYEKRTRELENQQQDLKGVVMELQKKKEATEARLERLAHSFKSRKGKLHWPVNSREIYRPFGTWMEDGIKIKNEGLDIKVKEGARVESVAPGKVAFARPYRGMGKVVIIQHGGSFTTLYGSLVELTVERGNEIKEGSLIGRAGQSSGLDVPRLYFQIFRGRKILNPEKWLK